MAEIGESLETKGQKMEVDYSATVDKKIPQCEALAAAGKLNEALDILMSLEKQTRAGADAISTGRILESVIRMCFEARQYDLLNDNIVQLTKKRGQLKQAVTKMVQQAFSYIEKISNLDVKLKLIDTLRTVTAGKIYVEVERARLSRILAEIYEEQGKVTDAATVLQELQVETFGSMEKKEKVEFILEQMRLCLAKRDFVRTQIISKKINTKYFEEVDVHKLKLKYYQLMIELDQHDSAYLAVCKHYMAIYNTPMIKDDAVARNEALSHVVMYLVLAPFDNEQSDLIHRVHQDTILDELPVYRDLLMLFITPEIMRWSDVCTTYEKELRTGSGASVFTSESKNGSKHWADLKIRTVEHNMRIMSKYYTRIRMSRMAELLDLTEDETEEFLSALVVNKTVEAKIDRLEGIVCFCKAKNPADLLDDWTRNISSLMSFVNKTTHLITKEEMVHKLL